MAPPPSLIATRCRRTAGRGLWPVLALSAGTAAPVTVLIARVYGRRCATRYLAGLTAATAVQCAFQAAMRRRIGPEPASPADLLTLQRGVCGALLAGLLTSQVRDRTGPAGWVGVVTTLGGATLSDWLDGPLARRRGPTRLGAVLDIEADSWLTLWAAATAVAWGELPRWCLLAPVLHYAHPARALWGGGLPRGGGPGWTRLTGTAQMLLVMAALAPRGPRPRSYRRLTGGIALGQVVAQLVLLGPRGQQA